MKDSEPAKLLWLLRPPVTIDRRTERVILLVGAAALFAGYDVNVFGLATPQIQHSLSIPENQIGLTLAYFRIAAIFALVLAASADLLGRRRLLLITMFGQAVFTLATAFAPNYAGFVGAQFLTRVFGYAEEMLCFVVIAEGLSDKAPYVARVTLNGHALERSYITDAEVRAGGELRFVMGAKPNRKWASGKKARPYSMSTAR